MHIGTRLQNYKDKHNKKVINLSVRRSRLLLTHCRAVPERRPHPWLTLDRRGSRRATSNSRTSSLDMSCGTNRIWCLFTQPNCLPNKLKQVQALISFILSRIMYFKKTWLISRIVPLSTWPCSHILSPAGGHTSAWSHCLKYHTTEPRFYTGHLLSTDRWCVTLFWFENTVTDKWQSSISKISKQLRTVILFSLLLSSYLSGLQLETSCLFFVSLDLFLLTRFWFKQLFRWLYYFLCFTRDMAKAKYGVLRLC